MNSALKLFFCIISLGLPLSQATLEPAEDARSYFSAEFYRRVVIDLKKENANIAVSPAAVQKFLTTVYKGTQSNLADRILFDIGIKHIDFQRLRDDTYKETGTTDFAFSPHLRRKQMEELAEVIDKEKIVKYFDEFEDKKDSIQVQNYIVVPENIKPKDDFKEFAKNYFNTSIVNAKSTETEEIKSKFGELYEDTENVELFSEVNVKAKINNSYKLANGNINAVADVQYYADGDRQYIELPLDNGLGLFIALADKPNEFHYFITQIVGRRMQDFVNFFSKLGTNEKVLVHLPVLNLESFNDLAIHFRAVAHEGLKQTLRGDAKLSEGFENWPENGPKIDHFWQRTVLEIESEDNTNAVNGPPTKTFDAIGKNFFYLIKSDIDFLVMGHHIGNVE